ncbi:MAG: Crp/Fnr family transcriptional regulator [Rhodoferax sp.]|nr:MAG: Crp/Fnr family transcriptional regulator [Rhodoferax sp.]
MSKLSNLDLVRRVPLFSTLTEEQASTLLGQVEKRRLARGAVLLRQGETSGELYVLLSGRARVVVTDAQGRQVILATMRAGDCMGEMSIIDQEPHSATVILDSAGDVLVLSSTAFSRCLAHNAAMAQAVMVALVQRLRASTKKIGSLALLGVYGRVATVLLDMAVKDEGGALVVQEKLTKQDIARMVGASREMVSRVMKHFEDQQFMQMQPNGHIRIFERRKTAR